jgi:phospholipid/cholesterol/gamma-HCH transport system substrate-binding protein
MDLTYKQEIGVGAIVLAGLALFVFGMFWLTGESPTTRESEVRVVFTNVSGLKQGDPVMVSGVKKGRVARVDLEGVGRVTVTLSLATDVRPRIDASAAVLSLDFFGAKFIDYNPGSQEQFSSDGTVIVGSRPPDVTDLAANVARRADELLGNASTLVSEQLGVDLRNTLIAMQRTLNVLAEVGAGPLVAQTTITLRRTERVVTRIDSILGSGTGLRLDTLSANLASLSQHLGDATASLDTILAKMGRGEGTLGRMATDTMLYQNLTEALGSLNALLTDLKERPGRYLNVRVF